ncbi:hypothetical protein ECEC4402_5990, partial [Escherichia coli EC4402]
MNTRISCSEGVGTASSLRGREGSGRVTEARRAPSLRLKSGITLKIS